MEELKATTLETTFRNPDNGYTVLNVRADKKETVVIGILPELSCGEKVTFHGEWVTHPQYGKQFKASSCEIAAPSTLAGIERYLGSGLIRGVGPATARLIVSEFGLKTMDILSEHPERLTEISGIGTKRASQIAESFQEQYATRQVMVFLQSYGISPAIAVRISKAYGASACDIVKANPYRMVEDVEGIGFLTADRIALAMGMSPDSPERLSAGLVYALQDASVSGGHTYLPQEELLATAGSLLRVDGEIMRQHLTQLLLTRRLRSYMIDDQAGVFLPQLWLAENEIARRLTELSCCGQTMMTAAIAPRIKQYEEKHNMRFSETQKQAITTAAQSGLLVITGGPGTGKTTIINCILSLLDADSVLLAAPTGRAAKRMSEATGREACTLHRLLGYGGEDGSFTRDEEQPLDCTCLIVDEMSMVDVYLMRAFLRALPQGAKLILVGDADQLPSVGAGNVLGDILKSGMIPSVRLTEIFRQAESSLIVRNAHAINHGEYPAVNVKGGNFFMERVGYPEDTARSIVALCSQRLPAFLKTDDPVHAIQVLSPTKKGPCGVNQLNILLQAALNPPHPRKAELQYGEKTFRQGDKVMHIRNNYQLEWESPDEGNGKGVFNGDMGIIRSIDTDEKEMTVLFDDGRTAVYDYPLLEEIELAYCLSVHKSQGSEFTCVVMPCVGGPPMLLTRNLFYTALTRARELVVLAGRDDCMHSMVDNNHIARRYTALYQRLLEMPRPDRHPIIY